MTASPPPLTPAQFERYRRHLSLPELGVEGQRKLLDGRVLLIGAGGLGCPLAQYLAAAGVGTLGLIDFDRVDLSNLQRQVLYATSDVGRLKVGMKADVHVDAYSGKTFKGEVFRIGQAATNRFALLPDPNPSGNFTKITQRLPLRLKLLDKDASLRPGMMVEVYIATGND